MANKKKDFSAVDTGRVYSAIEESLAEPAQETQKVAEAQQPQEAQNVQGKYTAQEIRALQEAGKTKGRKGVKMVRVNMAFTPTIHDYIRIMASVRGESITEFTNKVFEKSMQENAEIYKRAQEFRNSL